MAMAFKRDEENMIKILQFYYLLSFCRFFLVPLEQVFFPTIMFCYYLTKIFQSLINFSLNVQR